MKILPPRPELSPRKVGEGVDPMSIGTDVVVRVTSAARVLSVVLIGFLRSGVVETGRVGVVSNCSETIGVSGKVAVTLAGYEGLPIGLHATKILVTIRGIIKIVFFIVVTVAI